LCSE